MCINNQRHKTDRNSNIFFINEYGFDAIPSWRYLLLFDYLFIDSPHSGEVEIVLEAQTFSGSINELSGNSSHERVGEVLGWVKVGRAERRELVTART